MYNNKLTTPLAVLLLFSSAAFADPGEPVPDIGIGLTANESTLQESKEVCCKPGGAISGARSENSPRPGRPPPVYQRSGNSQAATDNDIDNKRKGGFHAGKALADVVRGSPNRSDHNPQDHNGNGAYGERREVHNGNTEPTRPPQPSELGHEIGPKDVMSGPTFPDPPQGHVVNPGDTEPTYPPPPSERAIDTDLSSPTFPPPPPRHVVNPGDTEPTYPTPVERDLRNVRPDIKPTVKPNKKDKQG